VTSSLKDSSADWRNCHLQDKESVVDDGRDFEHWLVVMEPPPGNYRNPDVPREEIIDTYIKTLAKVVGRYIYMNPAVPQQPASRQSGADPRGFVTRMFDLLLSMRFGMGNGE
jgi:hypothetical protein